MKKITLLIGIFFYSLLSLAQQTCIDFEGLSYSYSTPNGQPETGDHFMFSDQNVDFYFSGLDGWSGYYNGDIRSDSNSCMTNNYLYSKEQIKIDLSNMANSYGHRLVTFDFDYGLYTPLVIYVGADTLSAFNPPLSTVTSNNNYIVVDTLGNFSCLRVTLEGVFDSFIVEGYEVNIDNICIENNYCGYNDLSNYDNPFHVQADFGTQIDGDSIDFYLMDNMYNTYNYINYGCYEIYVYDENGTSVGAFANNCYYPYEFVYFPLGTAELYRFEFGGGYDIEDSYGCPVEAFYDNNVYDNTSTFIANNKEKQLSIVPNPVRSTLSIEMNDKIDKVLIYSLSGQLVGSYNTLGVNNTVDVSDLPSGTYIVKIVTHSNEYNERLTKL